MQNTPQHISLTLKEVSINSFTPFEFGKFAKLEIAFAMKDEFFFCEKCISSEETLHLEHGKQII